MKNTALTLMVTLAVATYAQAEENVVEILPPAEGSVTQDEGLAAWDRIYEVASHPRCSNCHVGPSNVPMWSGPSYGDARPHGMNINGGESRIGAEFMTCITCHTTKIDDWESANAMPHAAPRVAMDWQLAPVEAEWFGKSTQEICAQLRDPERNGGRTFLDIAGHLNHDLILHWAWNPGGGREAAPYDLQAHVNDVLAWGVAGMPCPQE